MPPNNQNGARLEGEMAFTSDRIREMFSGAESLRVSATERTPGQNPNAGVVWVDSPPNFDVEREFPEPVDLAKQRNMELAEVLKKRHLSRDERHSLHTPASDWENRNGKEILKCAATLEVEDIYEKYFR